VSDDDVSPGLEALVEQFLDRREREPDLRPEQFAEDHPDAGPALLRALHTSLELLATLHDAPEPLPETFAGYRVVRELGRGGMGVVYEVERDGVRRALKHVAVTALLQPRALQRFQREAAALQRLRHPGIVAVHEVGTQDGLPFLVMDLVDGPTLLHSTPMPWRRATTLVRDVARALAVVHDAGLCHRDLKPDNIVLRADAAPVVIDFGLVHDADGDTLTASGDLLGTVRYMAPEQAEGRSADARSDVHALGLILLELLHGEPAREHGSRSDLLAAAVRGLPRRRLRRPAGAPNDLVRVLRTALARRPEQRYADAAALAADLDRVLDGTPVRGRPPGSVALALDALRFHPRMAGVLVGLLLALLVGGAFVWRAAARATHAQNARHLFDGAVMAWFDGDEAAGSAGARATLAERPGHRGARALLTLCAGEAATLAPGDGEALVNALAARSAAQWQAAAAALRAAIVQDPACPLARILLAEAEEKLGHPAEADGELTAAQRLLPESAALAAALGALQLRRGDAQAAAASYRRVCDRQPDRFDPRYQLARACHAFDAEAALREITAAEPLLPPGDARRERLLRNLQAATLDKLGRSAEAVQVLSALAERHPDDPRVLFNLGYTLDRLARVHEAKGWYEKVLAIEPHNQSATLCLVWLLSTAADRELQDPDRAERLLVQALEADGGSSDKVLQMVREYGLRTRRIERLVDTMQQLAARPDLPQQRRATLEHTCNYLRNGVGPDGR